MNFDFELGQSRNVQKAAIDLKYHTEGLDYKNSMQAVMKTEKFL